MKAVLSRLGGLVFLTFAACPAQAITLGFFCISNTSATNCSTGAAQLSVDVADLGGGQVQFSFYNAGPAASSITDVYFDDGSLLGIASLIDADDGIGGDAGVDFTQGASPGNLPAGNNATPPFQATSGFLADANPAVQPNGVNPNEWLGIIFDLQVGQTFADVLAELAGGSLRIGIHVQGFQNGGSESFINNPVPVPAALWLFGSGLLALAGLTRRRRTA
jgi:hypothetical protein